MANQDSLNCIYSCNSINLINNINAEYTDVSTTTLTVKTDNYDAAQSVGLLWTSDQLVAETST